MYCVIFFFFKQKTAYEMRISDWSSDVCSSDLFKVFIFGGSININTLKYIRNSSFRETDATSDANNDFNYFVADDYLRTDGTGVSINLGIIFKDRKSVV